MKKRWLCNKSGKLSDSHTGDRVLGYGNRFEDKCLFNTTRKSL